MGLEHCFHCCYGGWRCGATVATVGYVASGCGSYKWGIGNCSTVATVARLLTPHGTLLRVGLIRLLAFSTHIGH